MTTNYCETFQFLNLIYNVPLLLILEQMIFSFRQNIVSEMLIMYFWDVFMCLDLA